jgi:hypothetical protein
MSVTWRVVSFWMEKLIEVLIRSFFKTEVLSVIQIETQVLKNKVFKTQGPEDYLTLKKKRIERTKDKSESGKQGK